MLHRIDQFSDVPPECRRGVVSIGNFDGVHRGHSMLIKCLRNIARRSYGPAVAFTFDPHPVSVLRPQHAPVPLTWTDRKAELLHEQGVDEVVVIHTRLALLQLSAEQFFDQVIRSSLQARGLVEGPNFGFGRDRSGTVTTLNRLGALAGIQLEVVDPLEFDGQAVSSTRIRQCLSAGQVEEAGRLLGRPHRVRGQVVAGAGRGFTLGFPTANMANPETFVPADGVYACRVQFAGSTWPAAVHIGANATFGESNRQLEAHLIGFAGELLGEQLEVDFLARLRGTQRFESPSSLIEQIKHDVERAAAIAGSGMA